MCGIAVVIGKDRNKVFNISELLKLSLAHRGPDADGVKVLETSIGSYLGFAHTRLSILDLSSHGNQPMLDSNTGNVIVFNGEIYNYMEIRDELLSMGEVFNSSSDTEVILKGCNRFGFEKLLSKLRGMFAFAWWDINTQILHIARDPLGIKPLYFHSTSSSFALSSELKALCSSGIIDQTLSINSVDSYLSLGSVQPPNTIYSNVYSLMPGHYITVTGDGRVASQKPYCCLSDTFEENDIDIRTALENSIKRHLVSDVPLGIMLSGGYDSTALACIAKKHSQDPLSAFTMNFPEIAQNSEIHNAKKIADYLNLNHKVLDIYKEDVFNSFESYFKAMDQPSDDGLNIFLISKKIRQHDIKACLHGAGGDELFGGYPSFKDVPLFLKLKKVPKFLRISLSKLMIGNGVVANKMTDLLQSDLDLLASYLVRRSLFSFNQRTHLLGLDPPMGRKGTTDEWLEMASKATSNKSTENSISTLELLQYSANKLMSDGDVMSMANGLELRVPLLDLDLVKAKHRSINRRVSGHYSKTDLIDSIDNFPHHLINKSKIGFTVPIRYWLNEIITKEEERVTETLYKELNFSKEEVRKTFIGINGSKNKGEKWIRSWQLFSLGMWLENNL